MIRYILRRTAQMIPTVFGVILITFILFNMVGGSPALMALGDKAALQDYEEFDELRGFNKPLFFGYRTTTRACSDSEFDRMAGDWEGVEGAVHTNGLLILDAGRDYPLPLKFSLRGDCEYELSSKRRLPDGTWGTVSSRFHKTVPVIQSGEAPLEIRSIRLRRIMNNPFDSQFLFYLKQIARFDFGMSHSTNQRVSKLLLDGLGPSLMLTVPVFFIGLMTSVALSLLCAYWRDTWVDRFFVVFSVALMSINYLVYIVAGQYVFAFKSRWFPIWGFEGVRYLALPILIGVLSGLGGNLRFYRTVMLDEVHRDYVRTARAKGVSHGGILFKHVLKNAMIPIITNVVIAIPFLYTGSLLLESFFGIPGLGYLGINAINSSDVDVVRALVLIGALMFVVANLLTDICYAAADPRVKLK